MKEELEFEKMIVALAIGIFIAIMSSNIASMFYIPVKYVKTKGYKVEIVDSSDSSMTKPGLPEVLDMVSIMRVADADKGEVIFKKCALCHTIAKNGKNKVGPNLWNIVGAKTAVRSGFSYSPAMHKRSEEGIKWTYEILYRYLYSPRKYVPGTKMAFAGIKDDASRANLIAYLRKHADNIPALP